MNLIQRPDECPVKDTVINLFDTSDCINCPLCLGCEFYLDNENFVSYFPLEDDDDIPF